MTVDTAAIGIATAAVGAVIAILKYGGDRNAQAVDTIAKSLQIETERADRNMTRAEQQGTRADQLEHRVRQLEQAIITLGGTVPPDRRSNGRSNGNQ